MCALMPGHLGFYRRQPERNSYYRQGVLGTQGFRHATALNQHQIALFQYFRHCE